MEVIKTLAGKYLDEDIWMISLKNEACMVNILNYGAIMKDFLVPGVGGTLENIILSYDHPKEYEEDSNYIGAIVGRYAGRIAAGSFTIDGQTYQLTRNENGNHLHGGVQGFNRKIWNVDRVFEDQSSAGVVLSTYSPHLEEGYPGNLKVEITYRLSRENVLWIAFTAVTDLATIINLTSHAYFNLTGRPGDIASHVLTIPAEQYLRDREGFVPSGSIEPVHGSVFDLRAPTPVSDVMHRVPPVNYVLREGKDFRLAATLSESRSGRSLEVRTTCPGLQLYCGNFLTGKYPPYSGICLEPQFFPDAPNHPGFPTTLLRPGEVYHQVSSFKLINP